MQQAHSTTAIQQLLEAMEQDTLLHHTMFAADLDAVLDARDAETFDRLWMQAHAQIERTWEDASVGKHAHAMVAALRKAAFATASKATGQHEIAGYVGDDFELIGKCLHLGLSLPFVHGLLDTYAGGQLPGGSPGGS